MLTTQSQMFAGYVDYFLSLLRHELSTLRSLSKYLPPEQGPNATEQKKILGDTIKNLKLNKRKIVLDSEILLLTVIDHIGHDQLEKVSQTCLLVTICGYVPHKFTKPFLDTDMELYIRNIVEHIEFVDTMSWFTF